MRSFIAAAMFLVTGANAGSHLDFSYGVLERLRGNEARASEFYEKAYAEDPSSMHLVRMMANKLAQDGNSIAAMAAWKAPLAKFTDDPEIWIEYGDFLGKIGKGDAVADRKRRDAYLKALKLAPDEYRTVERMIVFHREAGDDERARELLETLELDSPQALNYYVASTRSLYDSHDEKAVSRIDAALEAAMKEHPDWVEIARVASDHFRNSGRTDIAIDILARHLEAVPASLDLKIRLGILYFTADRDGEGVRALEDVLEIHPGKALAHESLAKYYRQHGKAKQARNHAAELLKIRGGTPDEFIKLADELLADGENRAARLLLEKAVFLNEEDADLMMKLATASSRDPEGKNAAARLFREAEAMADENAPKDPAFLVAAAEELIARGESKAAEEKLRDAIRTFPKDARVETAAALRALAGIWTSEGRNQDAAKALVSRADALEK